MKNFSLIIGAVFYCISARGFAMETGGFITGSIGAAKIEDKGIELEGDTVAYKLGGGYVFTKYFALEAYYADYGKAKADINVDDNTDTPKIEAVLEPFSMVLQAVGIVPVGPKLDLFGKAGVSFWTTDYTYKGVNTVRDDGVDAIFGLGGSININKHFAIRAELEVGLYADTDVSMLSAGVSYHFN